MKILVADDDPTLRTELADLLRQDGHEVFVATDGSEVLRLIEREPIEVALLDLKMPRASGLDVLHRLRVVKPYDLGALQRTLAAVAEERQARAALGPGRADAGGERVVSDAAARKALLAVLGPAAKPPKGAARTLRIADVARPPDVFTPSQLYHLNAAIEAHVARVDEPIVFAADLRMLEAVHGREDLKAWMRHISGRCASKGGALVLSGVDPGLVSEVRAEAETDEASADLQAMLESLANPIRRAVVGYVHASGPVPYSAILKMNFVDSSSKLSFHLQKLQSDGLLTKVDAGRYAVTEAGQRAWQVVRTLAERRHPSLLVSRA